MTTVVLVHGAWHRPETWHLLERELRLLGYQTRTPQLPSTGSQPLAGMHDDAAALAAELVSIEGPVVMLAHSYGGIPMTEAAAGARNVGRLIYLAAYLPDKGESMYNIHGLPDPDDLGGLFPTIDNPRATLYGDLPDAEAQAAVSVLVNQSVRAFAEKVDAAAWREIPTSYIVTQDDRAIPVALQEQMATHAGEIRHLAGGHSPFLSRPGELAALIDEIVRETSD